MSQLGLDLISFFHSTIMQHMWLMLSTNRNTGFLNVLLRFPLAYFWVLSLAILLINTTHTFYLISEHLNTRLISLSILAILWFTIAKIVAESLAKYRYLLHTIFICVFLFMAYYILSVDEVYFLFILLLATVLLFTNSPFLLKKENDDACWAFILAIGINLFFSLILATAIVVALIVIPLTIDGLFKTNCFYHGIHQDIAVIGYLAGAFCFLSRIPQELKFAEYKHIKYGIKTLLIYILIPANLIYLLILYAYMVKIIGYLEIPKNELGPLITTFGIIGVITHLLSYTFRKDSKILALFYEYFYLIFVPVVLLLIVAITLRINQYGLTENRYLICILTLWFSLLSFTNIFNKQFFSIKFVPIFLSILLFLSSFGPLGISTLPITMQTALLKKSLIKNSMLIDEKITMKHPGISAEEKEKIISIFSYLTSKTKGLNNIKSWFSEEQFKKITKEPKKRKAIILEIMGKQEQGNKVLDL